MPETKQATRRFAPPVAPEPPVEATTEEEVVTEKEEQPTPEPETPAVPEPPTSIKVKYVGGQGIELAYPLSNGQSSFLAGVVYELKNYGDFCRLTEASPNFVEVKDEPAR